MKPPRFLARRAVIVAVLGTALAAFFLRDLPPRWLALEDPPGSVDAAVVLSGDPWFERTATAAALVRSGQARLLVLVGSDQTYQGQTLRDKAVAMGVPSERVRCEQTARTTRQSMLAVAPILHRERVRSIALVTSPYHQRRAYLTARKALPGLTIRNRPASPAYSQRREWWRDQESRNAVLVEYVKLVYYAVRGWL